VIDRRLAAAKADLERPLHAALAQHFGPPAVLVDERGQIQQIHRQVGAFLQLPAGRVNVNVVDMAREGLRVPLASALREAIEADGTAVGRSVSLDGGPPTLRLRVSRLPCSHITARLEAGRARSRGSAEP
jgi:two-component system CheB/CheR fusion protein